MNAEPREGGTRLTPNESPLAAKQSKHIHHFVIAIATYKRPKLLEGLLRSVFTTDVEGRNMRVIVVDNDPEMSAQSVAHQFPVVYALETRPGIAAARNRGLDLLDEDDEAVIFVDDDETVESGWLLSLLGGAEQFSALVVTGPVITDLPPSSPTWISRYGFLQRYRHQTGTEIEFPATNNTLLRLDAWRTAGRPRFDDAFSITGGSDTDFFDRLRPFTGKAIWIDEAVVHEGAPPERLSFRWIARRHIRAGNVVSRVQQRRTGRIAVAAISIRGVTVHFVRFVGHLVLRRRVVAADVAGMLFNIGRLSTMLGTNIQEYRRTVDGTPT